MDDLYFDWRSHVLANRPENEGFSLQELLNIIPTDIPRDASEFDEELRNLIISLYSDVKDTSQANLRGDNQRRLEVNKAHGSTDFGNENFEEEVKKRSSKGVLQVLGQNETEKKQPELMDTSYHHHNGIEGTDMNSEISFEERKYSGKSNVELPSSLRLVEGFDEGEVSQHANEKDLTTSNIGPESDSNTGSELEVLPLMRYDQSVLNIHHDKGEHCLSNEIVKNCPLQNGIKVFHETDSKGGGYLDERALTTSQEGATHDSEITPSKTLSIDKEQSIKKQNENYQQNLDELGDDRTATLLNSVTGWFSKISSDSSKDLLGAVSLLEDLPSVGVLDTSKRENVSRTEKEVLKSLGSLRNEIEDHYSMPSEVSKIDGAMRQHSLSVIAEENDNLLSEAAEESFAHCNSNASIMDETLSNHDSGLGSLSVLSQADNTKSSLKQNADESSSLMSDDTLSDVNENVLIQNELLPMGMHLEEANYVDDFMVKLEYKLGQMEKRDKNSDLNIKSFNDLEGRFDQLSTDYGNLLKEKMTLKKVIWDLEDSLSFEKKMVEVNQNEKCDIKNQKAEIEAAVSELEDKVKGFEKECNSRDAKLKEVVDKLDNRNKCYEKLKTQAAKTESELKIKSNELEKTKSDLSSYISACSDASESREKCELQLKMLSEAFQKLKQSKDWLEFQLKTLSDSRAKMQLEFEESKAEQNSKATAILELQAENKKLSAKLVEMNFASAKEKKEILKGMEKVEEEILEHRAYFSELEKKNENLVSLLKEKDIVIETDQMKIKDLIDIVTDAESKVKGLQEEVDAKERILKVLKVDFDDVKAKLQECEKIIRIREEEKMYLSSANTGLEERILGLEDKVKTKEEDLTSIVEEKASLEKQLEAANEEKIEFERAVIVLKNDMQKVNLIFHVMKKDLASKSSMLQAIDEKKEELLKEMKDLQDYMSEQSQVQEELRNTLREKMDIIKDLSCQKEELSEEIRQLKERYTSLQTELDTSIKARKKIEADASNAKSKWMQQESKFQSEITTLIKSRDALDVENSEKEQRLISLKEEKKSVIANLRAKENKLSAKLRERQKEWLAKEENYESNILSLVNKLKDESIARQNVDRTVIEQSELMEKRESQQKFVFGKMKEILKSFNSLKDEKNAIKKELLQYKDSSSKLYSFLTSIVSRMCKQIEESASSNESLMHEIEELKTDLRNSDKSAEILKAQIKHEKVRADGYEIECEKREEEIRNLKKQIVVLKKEKDVGVLKLSQYKKSTESKIGENDNLITNYCKQVEFLQNENSMMLEKSNKLEENLAKLQDEIKFKDVMVSELETSLREVSKLEKTEGKEMSMLKTAYNELQGVIFSLENQLSIEGSQRKVLEDQIRNLRWQNKQAISEVKAKKGELELMKSQHQTEVQNITSLLSVAKTELGCLRDENSEIRKEKQKCNGQLIENRERLKRQLRDFRKLQSEVCKRNEELLRLKEDMKDCKSAATREMLDYIVKKAVINISKAKVAEDGKEKREFTALQTLRKCMAGLRDEMNSLHSEMSSQMDYLQGSKFKIKEFKENLGDLQTACKSLHDKSELSNTIDHGSK